MLYFLGKKKIKIVSKYSLNIFLNRIKKKLSLGFFNKAGHNLYGRITVFSKGGGLCTKFRFLDYHRILCSEGVVLSREFDFRHTGFIGCICYFLGLISYVMLPKGFTVGSTWEGFVRDDWGTSNFLGNMYIGSIINNFELIPGKGAQIMRAAGTSAYIYLKRQKFIFVKLPSGYLKKISSACIGSYGHVSFGLLKYLRKGSAGRKRLFNKRPNVRGIVMNPVDHPHGGGEGRKSQPRLPLTPWGKPGKWKKTSSIRTRKLLKNFKNG